MSDKKFWTSFAALKNKEELKKRTENEFAEDLPFGEIDDKGLFDLKHPRRDFLKYLGFSTAAATLAASCEVPVRKAVPLVNRPENTLPGVPQEYASTYVQDGDVIPVVVKARDGRPIKIEGNAEYPFTLGGTSPRVQASVLDLYDMYRIPHPKQNVPGKGWQEIPSFEQLDNQIAGKLSALTAPVVLLTSTVVSPTTKQIISDFLSKYPGSRHVQYDAVSYSGLIQAHGGKIPAHNFDKANVVVSLGADFLGTWLAPVEFARAYSIKRKLDGDKKEMSRHYQFESYLSMTGSSADERFTHRPSETGAVALALLAAVGGSAPAQNLNSKLNAAIQKVANDLKTNRGAALVVCGSNDANIQAVVREINRLTGALGSTIDTGITLHYRQGIDADMISLVQQMNEGKVGALLIYGANPAYDYADAEAFKNGLKKVGLTVSFNEKMDDTTELCQYAIPTHHYLESWGDAEPRTGYISFIQPAINPLFKTRAYQTSLLKWSLPATQASGNNTTYENYFQDFWRANLGGQSAFDKALQLGFKGAPAKTLTVNNRSYLNDAEQTGLTALVTGSRPNADSANYTSTDTIQSNGTTERFATGNQTPVVTTTTTGSTGAIDINAAITAITSTPKSTAKNEIALYQSVMLLSGKQAGNPWLLELPDPVTRATWDNYALISTAKAKELGIDYESVEYEYYQDKPLIELTAGNKKITIPALVVPGMDPNTIAVAVGYGINKNFNPAIYEENGVGKNVYPFVQIKNNNRLYHNEVTTSAKTVGNYKVARIQMHDSYEGRTEVLKETTLATFRKYPDEFKDWREELHAEYAPVSGNYRKEGTLYGDHAQPGIKWGMSIDLNSCIGCGACVVACHIENNVPVVGKNEVLRAHEMHWLRIDRYYVANEKNPDELETVIFQPMLCQHCDNAPCENVCPVAATVHSSEGINQMAYNRCIGTRYCANNCPYKVRRFNWGDYTGASTHGKLGPSSGTGKLNQVVHQMNDELTRMVLNPDVVTRSRGVMEKCSFCIQRTQAGKLKAKMENRELGADEVQTACAQACPTSAIVFGNVNKQEATVAQIRKNNPQRLFYVLEQLHTLPNVSYLAKIRNTDEVIEPNEKMGEHAGETDKELIPSQHEPAKEH